MLQVQIECLHEDLASKRITNRTARLALALEAKSAMEVFGTECIQDVTQAGRESLRIVCLPAEKSDSQTTTDEYLLLRGLSEEQIVHVGCVFGSMSMRRTLRSTGWLLLTGSSKGWASLASVGLCASTIGVLIVLFSIGVSLC